MFHKLFNRQPQQSQNTHFQEKRDKEKRDNVAKIQATIDEKNAMTRRAFDLANRFAKGDTDVEYRPDLNYDYPRTALLHSIQDKRTDNRLQLQDGIWSRDEKSPRLNARYLELGNDKINKPHIELTISGEEAIHNPRRNWLDTGKPYDGNNEVYQYLKEKIEAGIKLRQNG